MILPRVKTIQTNAEQFILPYWITMQIADVEEAKLSCLMECFFPKSIVTFSADEAHIRTKKQETLGEEAYTLQISGSGIQIGYGSYRGLRNALATVASMAVAGSDGYSLDGTVVEDAPVAAHRGVMLDLARGIMPLERVKDDVILIAKAKINILHLHLYDSKGSCMQLDSLPEACCIENYYSKAQMRELAALADALALEVIPEFDMPAHSKQLLKVLPDLGCALPDGQENTNWTICAGSEEVYSLYETVIQEIAEVFPGEYFHVGGDELEFQDLPQPLLCHWEQCSRCRQKMQEEGLANRQELLYHFLNRINESVKGIGRQMIMWSDQIDCTMPRGLSEDIIMHFWRVAGKGRGPHENCSMNGQLAMGYTMVNSYYPETYVDIESYISSEKLTDWRWDLRPDCDEAYKAQIIGSELCVWEYGNKRQYSHYDRSLAPAIFLMADKLWNGDVLVYDVAYRQALTKGVLGIGAEADLDLFQCLGDVLPPRTEEYAYYEKITCDKEAVLKTLEKLNAVQCLDTGSAFRVETYAKCLEYIVQKLN